MAEEAEDWVPEFKPGWPDLLPLGLIIGRSMVTQREVPEDDEGLPEEDDVDWEIHVGVTQTAPRLAFIGDLTVGNPLAFGGVTVVMPFALRHEEADITKEYTDAIARQYGDWVSTVMYDHAATVLRSALAGNGLPLDVPFGTPPAEIHTSDSDDAVEGAQD